jgi:hypothetical protein
MSLGISTNHDACEYINGDQTSADVLFQQIDDTAFLQ